MNCCDTESGRTLRFSIFGHAVCKWFYRIAGGFTIQHFNAIVKKVLNEESFKNIVRHPFRFDKEHLSRRDNRALGAMDNIFQCKNLEIIMIYHKLQLM